MGRVVYMSGLVWGLSSRVALRTGSLRGLAAAAGITLAHLPGSRGLSLEHQVPYIAAGEGAAFFARRVFRFAVFFFATLRRVFLAAPRAPTLRTVRFFLAFVFRLVFFAVIGM